MFIYSFVFCFNHRRIPKGSFPQNFVKIGLDLAEILRISKLDWRDGEGGKKEGRRREEGGEESYFLIGKLCDKRARSIGPITSCIKYGRSSLHNNFLV